MRTGQNKVKFDSKGNWDYKKFPWKTLSLIVLIALTTLYSYRIPVPPGASKASVLKEGDFEFIYDLSYQKDGEMVFERQIFDQVLTMVGEAREFIVVDMFLFNDTYDRKYSFAPLSDRLTQALVQQKRIHPDLQIMFITDEINTFYGAYPSQQLETLKENGIKVVITDLSQVRDSSPLYSGIWRLLRLDSLGAAGNGWLPNAFSPDSPKVTLRAYLRLLNFKANHRKVLVTENQALVTSFNPHDSSGNHSNIAFVVRGEVVEDLLESENAVAVFSGSEPVSYNLASSKIPSNGSVNGTKTDSQSGVVLVTETKPGTANTDSSLKQNPKVENVRVQMITEGKIRDILLEEIRETKAGDRIDMAMFYLGHHDIVQELINAANRGVEIRLVLDANKDAFGLEKNGVPNRPVAAKMVKDSDGKIAVRWYNTHGEQFHSKLTIISKKEHTILIGGSANLTRRNIDDYNLETDLRVILPAAHSEAVKVEAYFQRIWNNEGAEYTLDYEDYEDNSIVKRMLYEIQETAGLSSF